MNRDEATCIILECLRTDKPIHGLTEDDIAFASRLAGALDAIGILTYATEHRNPRAGATSQTQERSSPEHWAATRSRE